MKIAYNPITELPLLSIPLDIDITFDLPGKVIYARGVRFLGTDTTYEVFKKHTDIDDTGGYSGLVPAPSYTKTIARFLREDGNWIALAGLTPPDTELDIDSTNSVENRVITTKIQELILDINGKVGRNQIVTASEAGLAPKIGTSCETTINALADEWVLASTKGGEPTWRKLPLYAFLETRLYVGEKDEPNNSATTNGNTYLKLFENTTLSNLYNIKGLGRTTVTTDSSGNITITTPDTISWDSITNKPETFTPSAHTHSTSHIINLAEYAKAETRNALSIADTLNQALGKLEYKADLGVTAYDWYKSVTEEDNDDIINKWHEIVDFIDSVAENTDITDEFVTRKTELVITGRKTFNNGLIKLNTTSAAYILYLKDNVVKAEVGWHSLYGTFIKNENSQSFLNITDSGLPQFNGNEIYHKGNLKNLSDLNDDVVSGKYLPLSGGTLTGTLILKYAVPRIICYDSAGNHLGNIGFYNNTPSVYINNAWKTLLHSGNYSSYALPLTGGTLTGKLTINTSSYGDQLEIYRNQANGNSAIRFSNSEKVLGDIGVCGSGGEYPYLLFFTDRTTNIMFKIYHSGNSNLSSVDWNASKLILNTTNTTDWNVARANNTIQLLRNGSTIGNAPSTYSSGISIMTSYTGFQLATYGGTGEYLYFRSIQDNNTWRPWKSVAFTDSNVASATTALKVANTLTFAAGTFAAKTYNGGAAVTVNIPTKVSHLTNDLGYITSYTDTAAGKTFKTLSSVSHSGWVNNATDNKIIPTMSFIAYWNGAYASSNASNLIYSANGIIIGSSNYTTYTVKKDGTGASGTWGINITGNAATATNARYVIADNNAKNPGHALLHSGSGRADTSPEGDTWIYLDTLGGTTSPWGIKHEQASNLISFYGSGTRRAYIDLSNGNIACSTINGYTPITSGNIGSQSVNYASSAGNADKIDGYHYNNLPYLPLAGGTMNLGEGLKFHSNDNYFGTNADARIISLLDGNGTTCDGGLIIDERATYNGTEYVTELLRIRDSEFKWKGLNILHSGNSSVSKSGQTLTVTINGTSQSLTNSTYNFSGTSFTSGNQNAAEHNANNITSNGVWYYTANGPATSLGASTTDGALYSQAYSTSWVGQIAQDYRDGDLFTRGRNNGTWTTWKKVAYTNDIPTKTSQLTNDSGFITGSYYPLAGNANMSGDNKWIGSAMGGGTDYWRIGGTGTGDAGVCQITIGDNSNDYFQIVIADYSGTNYTALQVKSGGTYAPHFYESSDQRLKENIQIILNKDNIPQIKEFDWKEDGSHSYGLIAQELEELGYSELVSTKDDGYKTVNYSAALSLIVGKLQVKIKELEKEIETLKNKN